VIELVTTPIDPDQVVRTVASPKAGAVVTFDGIVRDHARGKSVTHLFYEAYPEMAKTEMAKIREQALERWPLQGLAIVHRTGRLEIGESSVFIAVASAHRADAFEACRFAIDTLKTSVPIWKQEHYEDGEVWIEGYGA
jgi:molybdopterin synthase catalytic subunit